MKRIERNSAKLEILKLVKALGRKRGYSFKDEWNGKRFLDMLESAFHEAKANPAILHGLRVQSMFEYIVVSLGKCVVVKDEDAGEIYVSNQDVTPPDFRLILKDGEEFFVEVKNFYQGNPVAPYRLKATYLAKLQQYAGFFGKELKIAIYWTRWNIWTLTAISALKLEGDTYSLSMLDAMKRNEMSLLGNAWIGTTPPLTFKVLTDPTQPRFVDEEGKVKFTIGSVELYCGDTRIDDDKEKCLAFYFMLFGDWYENVPAEIVEDQLISFSFIFEPPERIPGQGFEMIGSLSGMVSRHFNVITAPDGDVEKLSPVQDPAFFGIELPPDCKGKYLKLWCFRQMPVKNDVQ